MLPTRVLVGSNPSAWRTPGIRVSSPEKLRSRIGSEDTSVGDTEPTTVEVEVSIIGGAPVTSPPSAAPPGFRVWFTVIAWPTRSRIPFCSTGEKPGAGTFMREVPGGRNGRGEAPAAPETGG